tara:strand:+ start:1844 stop:4048 length:2205 start_codon:yes stop_codon:yes gene_type:complete
MFIASVFTLGIYMRWLALNGAGVMEFSSRDFGRALHLVSGNYIPLAGPDLSNGGRLPGPFLYFLLAIPLLIDYSYESVFLFNFLLNSSSIILLFLFLKKYFDEYFAALSSALLSISSLYIRAIFAPINPSFLPIFIVIYIGLLLEFALKKNYRIIPWMTLLLSLSIQIHYSMIVFFIPPLVIGLTFKIPITWKVFLKSLFFGGICFIPYFLYKTQTFIPNIFAVPEMWKTTDLPSWEAFIKPIFIQNSIQRIVSPLGLSYRAGLSIVIFSLILYAIVGARKRGVHAYSKEITLLVLLCIPAFAYEIAKPTTNHYWYRYIFIVPTVLIIVSFFCNLFKIFSQPIIRSGITFLGIFLIIFFGRYTLNTVHDRYKYSQKHLIKGSFQNTKFLHGTMMKKLGTGPKEYYDRVFFLGARRSSFEEIQIIARDENITANMRSPSGTQFCYFIIDPHKLRSKGRVVDKQSREQRYNTFLEDQTIDIISMEKISFLKYGFLDSFMVYKYRTKERQSCYVNLFNQFIVDPIQRRLIIQSKGIPMSPNSPIGGKFRTIKEQYDSISKLKILEQLIVFNNYFIQSPFAFKLKIYKEKDAYFLKGTIVPHFFYGTPFFNMKKLSVVVTPVNGEVQAQRFDRTVSLSILSKRQRAIDIFRVGRYFEILSENTLASAINFNERNLNYNLIWFRKLKLPVDIELIKNKFYIDLVWEYEASRVKNVSYSGMDQVNTINLIPYRGRGQIFE